MLNIRRKIILICLLLSALFLLGSRIVLAVDVPDYCQQIRIPNDKLSECIPIITNKGNELRTQANTLSSQIAVMDNQISLTEARIAANEQQISSLTLDIDTTTKKISGLQASLENLSKVLLNRIKTTYEVGAIQPFQMLLSSSNATNFFSRLNYLKIAQQHDGKLIVETTATKNDYANQKNIFEDKKKQIEILKKQQEDYSAQLDQQKQDKKVFLAITQNDAASYNQKLQAALAEQAAIQQIISGGGNVASLGNVKEGDVIAHVITGASACSSGTHLHFEVHKNGALQDPSNFLSSRSVVFDNSPDGSFSFNGSWSWPMSDSILIEQGFGDTYWAQHGWYPNPPGHTGIDIYSTSSSSVHAVKDGELFRGSISCGGRQLLFSRVDQSDDIQTYYLHTLP